RLFRALGPGEATRVSDRLRTPSDALARDFARLATPTRAELTGILTTSIEGARGTAARATTRPWADEVASDSAVLRASSPGERERAIDDAVRGRVPLGPWLNPRHLTDALRATNAAPPALGRGADRRETNVAVGTYLIGQLWSRIDAATPAKVATLYNNLFADSVTGYGKTVALYYARRPWRQVPAKP